jgi:SpoVK/Ycf46/Vps4 family AAA+-type ATPase
MDNKNKLNNPKMDSNDSNSDNYKSFHNKNKKKRAKIEGNKTININHYHLNDKNKPHNNNEEINKEQIAQDIINRLSLNTPFNPPGQDRSSPIHQMPPLSRSPVNIISPFENENIKVVHIFPKFRPDQEQHKAQEQARPEQVRQEHEPIFVPETFEEILITEEITHITDLIELSKKHVIKPNVKYSINLEKLNKIVPHLIELNTMIGMEDVKKSLTYQLMYFLQGFEYKHMLHTIIEGPPGVGKTCLGKILGKIYLDLDCINTDNLPSNIEEEDGPMDIKKLFTNILNQEANMPKEKKKVKFKIAKRSDLVGQYVGHTAVKTQKIINESFGGVLFIDEAYSLGGDDAFSKECINTINQNLSENGDKFVCIIAGYSDALENSFFSQNSGLHRRFPFRYKIEKYNGEQLTQILKYKIDNEKYNIDENMQLVKFIEENKELFPNYGGDIETYFFHIKIMHSTRVFGKSIKLRNNFIKDDFINALDQMKKHGKKEEKKPDYYN